MDVRDHPFCDAQSAYQAYQLAQWMRDDVRGTRLYFGSTDPSGSVHPRDPPRHYEHRTGLQATKERCPSRNIHSRVWAVFCLSQLLVVWLPRSKNDPCNIHFFKERLSPVTSSPLLRLHSVVLPTPSPPYPCPPLLPLRTVFGWWRRLALPDCD